MSASPIIIAIDGPSASGKGTVAKRLAAHFDFALLDTGLLYRAVGLAVLKTGGRPADRAAALKAAHKISFDLLMKFADDTALRNDASAQAASQVAAIPAVREALLKFQQDFCAHPPGDKKGAVLDGRDIGTVIAPHAPVKIFITASPEARALRRYKELESRGQKVNYDAILKDLLTRDTRDAERTIAPTKPAKDALILDTTTMTAEEVFAEALKIVEKKLEN